MLSRRSASLSRLSAQIVSLELSQDALNVKHGSATQLQASVKMARAAESVLGDQLRSGIVISQPESDATGLRSEVHLGSRGNIPDARAVQAATKALNMARQCGDGDILLVLISGGGSALLPVPVGSISLEDKVSTTKALATAGASINELNTVGRGCVAFAVRKHISAVKGGKLAAAAYPANVVSLILSDVLDDPIDVIASGPTTFDPSTFADALNLIESRGLAALVPQSVIEYLRAGAASGADETLKEGDARLSRSKNFVIGNNRMAAEAALVESKRSVYEETRHMQLTESRRQRGRCSHMALMVAAELQGTDGQDGPTDAAGAFCDGSTIQRSQALGLSYKEALETFDSYTFFEQVGSEISCCISLTVLLLLARAGGALGEPTGMQLSRRYNRLSSRRFQLEFSGYCPRKPLAQVARHTRISAHPSF
ncbi:hypothetical protein GUITHDRAFT_138485 [Guillardia theta CCMP2712]|uniref:MOFRL-associated domain-containing protein n=1 Tax=Guillardia theta (strain CCMP2712) TaxID=905079 RepID=L1JCZ8_GUITC|nr:hypothetical protein GUITHDRAFT_138485 [Guillardia theta CCMP2712]EKX45994.1 hypothetical protein GUITHDRAFT_138485 [Guillardia theta CCMP2712]|eukprot:XP_005832974.1 hypothetical protein GUITHDRAFT_138485 [Guillardia theta CCMP2712]